MKQHTQAQARTGTQLKTRTPTNIISITLQTYVLLPKGLGKQKTNLQIPEHREQKVIVTPCAINSSEESLALSSLLPPIMLTLCRSAGDVNCAGY